MSNVVVSISSVSAIPTRLVGNVTRNKDGSVAIAYREPGQIKEVSKSFLASEIVGALAGEAGFVIAMLNTPITKVVGELSVKDGVRVVKTENGTVTLNNIPGVVYDVKEVEADSKEARAAERASKVKVRASKATREARAATAAPAKKGGKADRIAAKKAARAAEASKGASKEKASGKSAKVAEVVKKKRRA